MAARTCLGIVRVNPRAFEIDSSASRARGQDLVSDEVGVFVGRRIRCRSNCDT